MKKIILFLFVMCSMSMFAQNAEQLKVLGIPLGTTTIEEFKAKLLEKGHEFVMYSDEGSGVTVGSFAGEKDCIFNFGNAGKGDKVTVVAIVMLKDEWYELESTYNRFKDLFTQKYGKPIKTVEEFTTYVGDNTGLKMYALKDGQCNYATAFDANGGNVAVTIQYSGGQTSVFIGYYLQDALIEYNESVLEDI